MIGRENIDEKIFQFFEGDLSSEESLELENFVNDNPEYKIDFDAWGKSIVGNENRKYKFAEDLLVNERINPKGWLRWSFAGSLFIGFIFASSALINNLDSGNDEQNNLELSKNKFSLKIDDSQLEYSSQKTNENLFIDDRLVQNVQNNKDILSLESQNITKYFSLFESKTNIIKEEKFKSELQNRDLRISNRSFLNNDVLQDSNSICLNSISLNTPQNNFVRNKQKQNLIWNQNKQNQKLCYIYLKNNNLSKLGSNKTFPPLIRKAKFNYLNPNKTKLFISNSKDPYLNYALAHTIEEMGSYVGDFNGGKGIRVEMLYRSEWPSVTSESFTSQIFSIDSKVDVLKGGLGLIINADRIGHDKLNSTAYSLIYSPKYIIGNTSIEPSFKYTYNQKNIAWNQVEGNDIKDPRNGILYASIPFIPEDILKTKINHHDLGFGLLVNTEKIYCGGQIDHLNRSSYSKAYFDQQIIVPYKISAMIGTDIMKNRNSHFSFSPAFNYIQFGVYNALWLNTQFLYQGFFLSSGFASNEEMMISLGYKNKKVRLVYGLGFSKPREFSGLPLTGEYYESHQLSLRLNLQSKK
jgi:hypothetical protein